MIGLPSAGSGGATLATISDMSAFARTFNDDTTAQAVLTTLGITPLVAELNYVDGVTSPIQTQLDAKGAADLFAVCTSNFVSTSDTTYNDVTGMTVTIATTGKYRFRLFIPSAATAGGGIKVQLAGVTFTIIRTANSYGAGLLSFHSQSTSAVIMTDNNAVTDITSEGILNITSTGTLAVQAAQNTSNVSATTVYADAFIELIKVG